jgi:ribosomal protein L35
VDESATEASHIAISAALESIRNLRSSAYLHSSRINAMELQP